MNTKTIKTTFVHTMYIMVILAIAFSITSVAYAAAPSPFVGAWKGVDVVDGSDIRLAIAGGGASPFHITWTESYFSFCEGKAGIMKGTGFLSSDDPNLLVADLQIRCFTMDKSFSFEEFFRYDANTDTITAEGLNTPQTWNRPH